MSEFANDPAEAFARFHRRKMIVLLVFVVVILGGTGIALVLMPDGAIGRNPARAAWLVPVTIALIAAIPVTLRKGRWAANAPEVKMVMNDEWRRTINDRASRMALIAVLLAQFPLAFLFGIALKDLPPPRPAFALAFATITLALSTQIGLFLYFDRE